MPLPGGEPLHVAPAEAGGGTERVGVVDEALPHEGHRLEARGAGGSGKPGTVLAVVHAPAVDAGEVLPRSRPSSEAAGPMCSLPAG